ncbi:Solid-state culture expressed protein (Aos23), putative [Penicillium digitatum]|uniref:Solid-state culture expressed protein (Aos23), putative n=3 Tax=Penicillium digitatum TaxID=36651 RepID=K9GAP8_PEND2|nr:Solid-state culture expressed protein (Aos23), putative [Penicillium digitatum Pd1]EKV05623.1 Solid-state culture expressed protein (Aos23), putative [Penicillium digitatum Pd1]EKV18217.1 Solid-state culture expressed protein (Aos23), putative [Penicillium digitatum PHI26]QQK40395.1 Solid-state culture expressed protein (Aos23), putative [Penicillium digitatum]
METVNKYVNSASTVIWGENGSPQTQQHGEEPISGVQGKGCVTDPYDGGNRDEQPGAIQSDVNTAPQYPIFYNKRSKSQGKEITSITTPHAPTSISACTSVTPALPISSGSTEASRSKDDNSSSSNREQRSISQVEGGASSESPHPSRPQDVSKEALQGPQGPAPRPAEDFEKEYRGKKSAGKDDDIEQSSPSESSEKSNDSPLSNMSESSSHGSGRHGTVSKVKESVKKRLHHSSK